MRAPAAAPLQVLYEDNHLLAVNKPAGLATMGVADDVPSLLWLAKDYIKRRYQKPGNVYLGIVSRLDAPVTGVVVLARTSKAAARLSEQFRQREASKLYWALVEGRPVPPAGTCENYLVHDERHRRVCVVDGPRPEAQLAQLDYRTLAALPKAVWLEVRPHTGRKHQIRVQLSARGWPILGDRKYGARMVFAPGIALHARSLVIEHPVQHVALELVAPPPPSWAASGVCETKRVE